MYSLLFWTGPRKSKTATILCTEFIGLCTLPMWLGVIWYFNSSINLVSVYSDGVISVAHNALDDSELYINNTSNELTYISTTNMEEFGENFNKAIDDEQKRLNETINGIKNRLAIDNITKTVEDLLEDVEEFTVKRDEIGNDMNAAKGNVDDVLTDLEKALQSSLCRNTNVNVCDALETLKKNLEENFIRNIESASDMLQSIIVTDSQTEGARKIIIIIDDTVVQIDKAKNDFKDEYAKEMIEAIDQMKPNVEGTVDGITASLQTVKFNEVQNKIDEIDEAYFEHGNLALAAFYLPGVLLIIIGLTMSLGLMMGLCYTSNGSQRRRSGVIMLQLSLALSFLLGILFWTFSSVFFGLGFTLDYFVCDSLDGNSVLRSKLDEFINDQLGDISGGGSATNVNISLDKIMEGCKEDKSIYETMKLETVFNLTNLSDWQTKYHIKDKIEDVKTNVRHQIDVMISAIEIKQEYEEAATSISKNLNIFIDTFLPAIKNDIKVDKYFSQNLLDTLDKYPEPAVENLRKSIGMAKNSSEKVLQDVKETNFTSKVAMMKNFFKIVEEDRVYLKNDGKSDILNLLDEIINNLIDQGDVAVGFAMDRVRNGIGKCKPMYDAIESIETEVCVNFAGGIDGIWVGLGIFALFNFISSIFILFFFLCCESKKKVSDKKKSLLKYLVNYSS